jgi:K(+)-stimulated pyrophosphate-energized sodium pump
VELAVSLTAQRGSMLSLTLAAIFFIVALYFVYRSFYGMRIEASEAAMEMAPEKETVY